MGDVAMTVPVIDAALRQNPSVKITVVTRKAFIPLFHGLDVDFVVPDLYGKHKGILGLYRLFKDINSNTTWDAVLDLHDVLRSKILRRFFKLYGIATFHIDKGRKEKKALTSKVKKEFKQLKHTTERYAAVFRSAGFEVDLALPDVKKARFSIAENLANNLGDKTNPWIGIAPFAQHQQKMYPIEKMQAVINLLSEKGFRIFVFGGGEKEKILAEGFCKNNERVTNLIGQYSLIEELGLLNEMDVVMSMDSANMHMAAMTNTQVISIWGSTHPYAGFSGYGQNLDHFIQIPESELPCRPCSVFGNKPCFRGDFACMNQISPESIVQKIESLF